MIVARLVEVVDLRDVTLLGNDTGGAICQIVISEPVSIVWGDRDPFFSPRLESVSDSRAFVPEDRPDHLAELIDEFLRRAAHSPVAGEHPEGVSSGDWN